MKPELLWQGFLDTGAPELYLLYRQAMKTEKDNVLDDTGGGAASHPIQGYGCNADPFDPTQR